MKRTIKQFVQKPMIARQHKEYTARLQEQSVPFDDWLCTCLQKEEKQLQTLYAKKAKDNVYVVSFREMALFKSLHKLLEHYAYAKPEIILFVQAKERLMPYAVNAVSGYFEENTKTDVIYPDETSYFKPGYSPELLESFFSFGNVFAVRVQKLEEIKSEFDAWTIEEQLWNTTGEEEAALALRQCMYRLALLLKKHGRIAHFPFILMDSDTYVDSFIQEEEGENGEAVFSLVERHDIVWDDFGDTQEYEQVKSGLIPVYTKKPHVQVVIPSKDNPRVLSTCIHSLLENTDYPLDKLEITVVDNGSLEENRAKIEEMRMLLREDARFTYHYEKIPFNFARMCNLGASRSSSDFILFLNDDIEIVEADWLSKMMQQAQKEKVGCVGAKLLYPDRKRIQHVGIQNIHLGPCHKLQFEDDAKRYYHGMNRHTINALAVTGACLLIKRSLFAEIGGFDERLQVAFNDVELGFRTYSMGYRNICCNNTALIHHESLSRGLDEGLEKLRRLHAERDYLFTKYPDLWNKDPYLNEKLCTDILDDTIHAENRFCASVAERKTAPMEVQDQLLEAFENEGLYMGIEFAGKKSFFAKDSTAKGYYIQGWSYAVEVDNSRYDKSLLLLSTGEDGRCYVLDAPPVYRPDMEQKLPYIDHPALCGVCVSFSEEVIVPGEYRIGFLWRDTCSRQKFYRCTGETVVI